MAKQFTYSFLDVQCTLTGPGGIVSLGNGAAPAEEGITIEPVEELDTMHIGADGSAGHSLHGSKAAKITVRLLKTSLTNALLQQMLQVQRGSSLTHGRNTMVISNIVNGDVHTAQQVAFAKQPNVGYAKEAGTIDWEFNASRVETILGGGGLIT